MPGVQKPHWLAPVAANAAAQRSRSSSSRPSTVVTTRPATRRAGVTQATLGAPSTSTVQQPHWPWGLHPSFGLRTPEPVPQHRQQAGAVVGDLHLDAVDDERGPGAARPVRRLGRWGGVVGHPPQDRFRRR